MRLKVREESSMIEALRAVSYTHLDVYKRQQLVNASGDVFIAGK